MLDMSHTHLGYHVHLSLSILLFLALTAACTSRVVYDPPPAEPVPNAVNINTADAAQLEMLPGLGRKIAEAIVRFREKHGPFERSEHLMQIRGISENRFLKFRHLVRTE